MPVWEFLSQEHGVDTVADFLRFSRAFQTARLEVQKSVWLQVWPKKIRVIQLRQIAKSACCLSIKNVAPPPKFWLSRSSLAPAAPTWAQELSHVMLQKLWGENMMLSTEEPTVAPFFGYSAILCVLNSFGYGCDHFLTASHGAHCTWFPSFGAMTCSKHPTGVGHHGEPTISSIPRVPRNQKPGVLLQPLRTACKRGSSAPIHCWRAVGSHQMSSVSTGSVGNCKHVTKPCETWHVCWCLWFRNSGGGTWCWVYRFVCCSRVPYGTLKHARWYKVMPPS